MLVGVPLHEAMKLMMVMVADNVSWRSEYTSVMCWVLV